MVNIIEHSNYKAPIDNEKVALIHVPKHQSGKNMKAFKIMEGVWIIPERFNYYDQKVDSFHVPISDRKYNLVYDNAYLSNSNKKSEFLKQTTILFKRLMNTSSGANLLTALNNGLPMISKRYNNRANNTIYLMKKNSSLIFNEADREKSLPVSLLIFGAHQELAHWHVISASVGLNPYSIYGNIAEMYYAPDVSFTNFHPVTRELYVRDPVVSLYHELIHVFHHNYGAFSKITIPRNDTIMQAEEMITFGGVERVNLAPHIDENQYFRDYKNNLVKIAKDLNRSLYTEFEKKYYSEKYFFNTDNNGKYKVSDENVTKFITLVRDTFSEDKFAKELGVINRYAYYDEPVGPCVRIDITLPSLYSHEVGFLKGQHIRENNLTDHPNSYLGANQERTLNDFKCTVV